MGKTPLYFALDDAVIGLVAVADTLKKDSRAAIARLDDMGVETVMLTGDNERTANAVGREAGVKTVIAGVKPDGKEKVIRELSEGGKTAMVGDGINDAPALTRADVGIAIGAGADVAIDAADVVLVKSRPSDIPRAVKLSRATLRTIHQNLFWAFIYNVIGIPLAAGLFIPLLGWEMDPMFGAAAMSLSSFCVVMNALRLNFVKLDTKKDIPYNSEDETEAFADIKVEEIKINERNINAMNKITLKIEGMMCPHCEARVKQTLEGVNGVASAEVSHTAGTAIVTCADTISRDSLAKTVEAQGYKVIG
jgi:Cu2+-exporting ATPase